MRQEIDGPLVQTVGVCSLWRDTPKQIAGQLREEAGPCPDRRDHVYFLFTESGDLFDYTCTERLLGDQKRSDVNLPISLFTRLHLG